MTVPRRAAVVAAFVVLPAVAGCSDDPAPEALPSVPQRIDETVEATLGGVDLVLEVADEPAERSVGLMGRTEVPAGTGMVFRYDEPLTGPSFYMFQVPVPLTAVFVRDGTVVHVAQMEPCREADPLDCPQYGPDGEFDTVVETAPATLRGVGVGDRLELRPAT